MKTITTQVVAASVQSFDYQAGAHNNNREFMTWLADAVVELNPKVVAVWEQTFDDSSDATVVFVPKAKQAEYQQLLDRLDHTDDNDMDELTDKMEGLVIAGFSMDWKRWGLDAEDDKRMAGLGIRSNFGAAHQALVDNYHKKKVEQFTITLTPATAAAATEEEAGLPTHFDNGDDFYNFVHDNWSGDTSCECQDGSDDPDAAWMAVIDGDPLVKSATYSQGDGVVNWYSDDEAQDDLTPEQVKQWKPA